MSPDLYIGLMSGTSLDGVDAVLVDFAGGQPALIAASHIPYDAGLRRDLIDIHAPGHDELDRAALLALRASACYADAVAELLDASSTPAENVAAIGCHGQTVRHRPDLGFTIQLANPAHLAEDTGITVVADFRNRDIAAGGQGAPLVPAFHRAVFGSEDKHRTVANIGGIANLTNLAPEKPVTGFDCGPGNMLMDAWALQSLGERYDREGSWAKSGRLIPELLRRLLDDPYFRLPPPKSTGRDLFNSAWLAPKLEATHAAVDVQRTLLEFTIETLAQAVESYCAGTQELLVAGGGARNLALFKRISERLHPITVMTSDIAGIAAEHVEAMAFAWLARQTLNGLPGNVPEVTGARGPRVLGAIYPV